MPTVGSLFSGIGGLDLGLERAGWTVRWQVENDPFCQRVLAKHWPDVPRYGDIRTLTGAELERVDLIAGGFPCQPVSVAGKRLAQADERWLWPEFARLVRVVRPHFVLVENVPGLLGRGMGDVLGDLATLGYDAEWDGIPAAAVSAPHLRDRIFLVAYPYGGGRRLESVGIFRCDEKTDSEHDGGAGTLPNPSSDRWAAEGEWAETGHSHGFRELRRTGAAHWLIEPDVGRVAHGVPARLDRLRGLGNAVVPQIAEWIGRRLMTVLTHGQARAWGPGEA